MRYYLIAGEASGDLHAANLMRALKLADNDAEFRYFGGDEMQAVGGKLVRHYREMAYMGFIPVLLHLRTIMRNMNQCKHDIVSWKPDVVILVDYPGFNLEIAEFIHKQPETTRPKVFYYISPKIWAWKEYRIKSIRRNIDALFSILPFEVEWFHQRNYNINYVGNPCVDAIANAGFLPSAYTERTENIIAILAGSRRQEIRDNLQMMLKAASPYADKYRIVMACAPNIEEEYYRQFIPYDMNVELRFGATYETLSRATAALVVSGTATLETAILRTPQVVCYYTKFGKLFSFLRKHALKVPFISLVNLIAGKEIVTELVASEMTVSNLQRELAAILPDGNRRNEMIEDYEQLNQLLGGSGASHRAATMMVELLSRN